MAVELTWDDALSLLNDLTTEYSKPDNQAVLHKLWKEAGDDKVKKMKAKADFAAPIQFKCISKYGFTADRKGALQSTLAYKPWNHHMEVHLGSLRMLYSFDPDTQAANPDVEAYIDWCRENLPARAPEANARPKPFTVEMARAMQDDLIAGYSGEEYQAALKEEWEAAAGDQKKFKAAFNDINFHLVQGKVLEKYGFENSKSGAVASFAAFQPYNFSDPEVIRKNVILSYYNDPTEKEGLSLEEYVQKAEEAQKAQAVAAKDAKHKEAVTKAVDRIGSAIHAKDGPEEEPTLTLESALALQEDLIARYRAQTYQDALRKALEESGDNKMKRAAARRDINLEYGQASVLEKYGFLAGARGVQQSLKAFLPLNSDPAIGRNNLIMMYLTDPDHQSVSLDKFLEEQTAAAQKAQEAKPTTVTSQSSAGSSQTSPSSFTLEDAIAMQVDLIAGYREQSFQDASRAAAEASEPAKRVKGKRDANFTVQSKVFPKYGFETSPKGVQDSLKAFMPYNLEPTVARNNSIMLYLTDPKNQAVAENVFVEEQLAKVLKSGLRGYNA